MFLIDKLPKESAKVTEDALGLQYYVTSVLYLLNGNAVL